MSKWKLNENSINEFLWTCAGVNKNILRLYPSEYAKYAGSGGTILFTAMMAFISGSYAMFFVFSNAILSLFFGIFWALLIFNLDRFIVNSMHTDGKDTLSWKKIQTAMPRIIMAIFLGIVISTPLEMKIFNDRIESQLLKDNIERINSAKNESSDYKTISLLQAEQNQLTKDRKQLVDDLQKAQKELKEEAEGNALSGIAGHGTIYRDKETYVNQCKQSLQEWDLLHKERLTTVQKRIDEVNKHIEKFEGKIDGLREDGFSARYEAFSNLKEANNSLAMVSFMITMLFIIIEVTPTFFKLIMASGPYEEHLQIENYKITAYVTKEKNGIDTELKIDDYNNKEKLKAVIKQDEPIINVTDVSVKPIVYSTIQPLTLESEQEPEEVPYIKSNTSIITTPVATKKLEFKKNEKGQIMLDFSSRPKKLNK